MCKSISSIVLSFSVRYCCCCCKLLYCHCRQFEPRRRGNDGTQGAPLTSCDLHEVAQHIGGDNHALETGKMNDELNSMKEALVSWHGKLEEPDKKKVKEKEVLWEPVCQT